ncbi:unnamed protein product [Closterium sp. NIES-54]
MVTNTTPGSQRVSICTCTRTGRHLATFTRRPMSSQCTLATKPPQVAASAQVSASGPVAPPCSFRLLSHQNLLWHHRLGHPSLPRLRGMHSRLLVYVLPRSLPPLPPSPALPCLPCVKGRQRAAPLSSFPPTTTPLHTLHMDVWGPARVSGQGHERYSLLRFHTDLLVLRLHSDRGGEFSSDLLRDFCRGEGILQSFMLPASPQQNGVAERRIGLVMEVARTSMIHAAAPHFLWPFAVRGSRAFVHDTFADNLSIPCIFLGFPLDAPGWQFYHPTSRRVLSSQRFCSSRSYSLRGGATRGAASGGAEPVGAGLGGTEPACTEPGGAEPEGAEPGGAEPERAEPGGAEPERTKPGGTFCTRGLGDGGTGAVGGTRAAGPRGTRTGGTGAAGAGGAAGVGAGDPGAGDTRAGGASPGGAGAVGAGSGGTGQPRPYFVPLLQRFLVSLRTGRCVPHSRPPPVLGTQHMALCPSSAPLCVSVPSPPAPSLADRPDPESDFLRAASPTVTRLLATVVTHTSFESTVVSALVHELVEFASACRLDYAASLIAESDSDDPLSVRGAMATQELCWLTYLLTDLGERPCSSPVLYVDNKAMIAESASVCPPSVGGKCALGTHVLGDPQEEFQCFAATLPHLVSTLLAPERDLDAPDIPTPRSYAEAIEGPYSSQWQAAMDAEMASWKSIGTYVDEVPPPGANIVSGMWIFRVKRPPGFPLVFKARYVAQGFSQRQGVDYFQTFSPTPKMTTLRVLLHVAAQRDYELHSLDFSTAFLQGSLHEEIWLRCPPGFTGSFPPGTQWSLRRPVYGLRQAPREWNDTLRTTLAALGFALSTADPSLFLRTDTLLPPFYILVYVDDLVFAMADTVGLAHVKLEVQKRHTCTDLGELRSYLGLQITRDRAWRTITLTQSHMVQQVLQRFDFTYSSPQATPLSTRHSLSALPLDESVEPSGPYLELVGCLMYMMTCTQPDLAYPLSILAHYVAPGRHRPEHMAAAKRVLRYLCSTSGLGLVLGGRSPVVLTGHADGSWELRWLTYLLTDLGEPPRSPPVLYVDNKAMLALCREHRLEHRTKHIALRYFLARELQQRGQLRLAYVASQANTADIFTKALQPCDHQRFCTMLAVDFEVWVDDLQLFLQCDRADGLSLFDLTSGASPAPAADADPTVRSQWATRDAAARLAVRRHLPTTERAHFSQYKSAHTLYDAVVARYSSPVTAALSRLALPFLFPDLAAFHTVADLITHLRTIDTRYRAALPADESRRHCPLLIAR